MRFNNEWLSQSLQDVKVNLIHPRTGAAKWFIVQVPKHGLSLQEKLSAVYQAALSHFATDIDGSPNKHYGMQKETEGAEWYNGEFRNELPPFDQQTMAEMQTAADTLGKMEKFHPSRLWPSRMNVPLPPSPTLAYVYDQFKYPWILKSEANMYFSNWSPRKLETPAKNTVDMILAPLWGKDK